LTPADSTPLWESILNNGSVAAFVGAFAAYFLVVLTDQRRRRKSKRQLRLLARDNAQHARTKLSTVENLLGLLSENKFVPAPTMAFPTEAIKVKQLEVIDLLSSEENRSLDAVLYWMVAIDGLLHDVYDLARELRAAADSNANDSIRLKLAARIRVNLEDTKRNLEYLAGMLEAYAAGDFKKILNFRYQIG